MTNPLVHTLVFIAAVLIPGGLLVYFAWRATRKAISLKGNPNQNDDSEPYDEVSDPDSALSAFLSLPMDSSPFSTRIPQTLSVSQSSLSQFLSVSLSFQCFVLFVPLHQLFLSLSHSLSVPVSLACCNTSTRGR